MRNHGFAFRVWRGAGGVSLPEANGKKTVFPGRNSDRAGDGEPHSLCGWLFKRRMDNSHWYLNTSERRAQ